MYKIKVEYYILILENYKNITKHKVMVNQCIVKMGLFNFNIFLNPHVLMYRTQIARTIRKIVAIAVNQVWQGVSPTRRWFKDAVARKQR